MSSDGLPLKRRNDVERKYTTEYFIKKIRSILLVYTETLGIMYRYTQKSLQLSKKILEWDKNSEQKQKTKTK